MTNSYYYKGANPTVDLVLINPEDKILLILRSKSTNACPDMWAIPGGFIDTTAKQHDLWKEGLESAPDAALRELAEETGMDAHLLDKQRLEFNNVYEGNNRDPRDNKESWSKSHAFFYRMTVEEKNIINSIKGINDHVDLDDAVDTKWFSIEEISHIKLAFDHNQIIEDTIKKIYNAKNKITKKPA